jgi:predicted Zn-dependent protease with MMP-like domain
MKRELFERLVADALATIPRRFRAAMANLAIVVEDEPSPELLGEMEIEPPDTLLGLYQGIPLTERRWDYGNALPDRILLFKGPLSAGPRMKRFDRGIGEGSSTKSATTSAQRGRD